MMHVYFSPSTTVGTFGACEFFRDKPILQWYNEKVAIFIEIAFKSLFWKRALFPVECPENPHKRNVLHLKRIENIKRTAEGNSYAFLWISELHASVHNTITVLLKACKH